MPIPPKDPFPKPSQGGELITGQDYNDLIDELTSNLSDLPPKFFQHGIASVTINAGTDTGTTLVTFPNAFPAAPRVFVSLRPSTVNQVQVRRNYSLFHTETTPAAWVIPSTPTTEIFGNTRCRKRYEVITPNTLRLNVALNNAGFGVLYLQRSPDQTTWTSVPGVQVDAQFGPGILSSIFQNEASSGDQFYRIVGDTGDDVTATEFLAAWFETRHAFRMISCEAFNIFADKFTAVVRSGFPVTVNSTFNVGWMAFKQA